MYIYVCMYACMCIYLWNLCMYVCIVCVCVCARACMHVYIFMEPNPSLLLGI